MLDSTAVPEAEPMAQWRKSNPRVCEARKAAKPSCEKAAAKNIEVRLPEFRKANPGVPDDVLRRTIQAATEGGVLGLDFVVYEPDWTPMTVRTLLACLELGNEPIALLDPAEPDYDGGRAVAMAYLNDGGTATINSFAHGGNDGSRVFDLTQALRQLQTEEANSRIVMVPTSPEAQAAVDGEVRLRAAVARLAGECKEGLVTQCLADIKNEPIEWAWKGRIAKRKLNLIGGESGKGKSQFLVMVAATITTGRAWPDGEPAPEVGGVLYIQGEDGPADTIGPRFDAVCGNRKLFHVMNTVMDKDKNGVLRKRPIRLDIDIHHIEAWFAVHPEFKTLMIDPVTAYLGDKKGSYDDEVRSVLTPLADTIGDKLGITIVAIAHLNKGSNGQGVAGRISGSGALVQVPRVAHMLVEDPDDPSLRVLQLFKRNICKDTSGASFRIESCTVPAEDAPGGCIETSRLVWVGLKTVDLDAALDPKRRIIKDKPKTRKDEAKEFIIDQLKDGPKLAFDLRCEAVEDGISEKTLDRASEELGIIKRKPLGVQNGRSTWELPAAISAKLPIAVMPQCATGGELPQQPLTM